MIQWKLNKKKCRPFTGIPELGIDHFEPLVIDSVQVSKGSGSLTLAGGFKNLIIKGPSNATVSRARYLMIYECICATIQNIFQIQF